MAGFASVAASTYHWSVSQGSTTASPRWAWGTACVCGSTFSSTSSAARSVAGNGTAQEALDGLVGDWTETFEDDGKL
jgi:pectin methylesterase-like acyl-CoA thioesterase